MFTAYRLHPELFPKQGSAEGENAAQKIAKEAAYYGAIRVTTEGNGIIEPADTTTVVSDYTVEIASSAQVAGIALGFSILVGVVFGIYPANKAAG